MSTATIIERARSQGRVILSEVEAKQILAEAGIPVVETRLARNPEEAVAIANELGYPVALKIVSPQITHKSDVGGVRLNVQDARGVVNAFEEIVNNARRAAPDATVEGVSVQRMAKPGVEVIIGMTKDPQFGPVLMFGLGGILVEVLKDVAFRIVPLAPRDAKQMIREIKGYPLLEGYRGQPPSDVAALEAMLLKLSEFVDAHPELAELDLNPVFAYPEGAVAVDARIVLEKEA